MDTHPDWKFCQVFGDDCAPDAVQEADIISTIEFDRTGRYLAAGDRGGRVVLFERFVNNRPPRRTRSGMLYPNVEYRFLSEFQSHEKEFDYLRSLEISEEINSICWLEPIRASHMLLTSNERTVKLWKVTESYESKVIGTNAEAAAADGAGPRDARALRIPQVVKGESLIYSMPRRIFNNAHAFHINSVSACADGATFISTDDLCVNCWWLENESTVYTLVDIKPDSLDDLAEVITVAKCHPTNANLFAYATSLGQTRLCDVRQSALSDRCAQVFALGADPSINRFFAEVTASVSDFVFSRHPHRLVTRDYLRTCVWDTRKPAAPLHVVEANQCLRKNLQRLHNQDALYDRFNVSESADAQFLSVGTYSHNFNVFDTVGRTGIGFKASRDLLRRSKGRRRAQLPGIPGASIGGRPILQDGEPVPLKQDLPLNTAMKTAKVQFHPLERILAVATTTNIYIYAAASAV
eukprot:gnl/Chilomastix_cuspidata/4454.p1 GENE.gnl/Chilomastix_cuspidata/4454~~gnl/Chilomastix_cuspidata/4454.p1  ORF type:complete len:466 (-),score=198.57 gnl/Chilomastix_cuspidata/4454:116-1513(-)